MYMNLQLFRLEVTTDLAAQLSSAIHSQHSLAVPKIVTCQQLTCLLMFGPLMASKCDDPGRRMGIVSPAATDT